MARRRQPKQLRNAHRDLLIANRLNQQNELNRSLAEGLAARRALKRRKARLASSLSLKSLAPSAILRYEDRRNWRPEPAPVRAATLFSVGITTRNKRPPPARPYKLQSGTLATLKFREPDKVPVCVRRKIRAQVLHALGKTGRGRGGGKKHYNAQSSISCR